MYLARNVHLAAIGQQAVVLDIENDRYFGLGAGLTEAALRLLGPDETAIDDDALRNARDRLVARGVLSERPQAAAFTHATPAHLTLWPALDVREDVGAASGPYILSALRALAETQAALSVLPFHRIIAWLQREKARAAKRGGAASAQHLVDAFVLARPWFPIRPICRLDAVSLCLLFWRHGRCANLIFGVRLEPFYAHCWAQEDGTSLNEADDSLRQYTPILVI